MFSIRQLVAACGLISLALAQPVYAENNLLSDTRIKQFIDELVEKHNYPRSELEAIFSQTEILPEVLESIKRPYEKKPWFKYRTIFVTDTRISEGVAFLQENYPLLKQAEEKYGVPAEIITAILGVETRYGRYKGKYRVVDSLTTLGFEYPRRSKFFRKELEQFLLLSKEEAIDPLSITGSYAGAIGKAQFIPSSYRHYAIDFNGDGTRDLMNTTADAVGSIASYLSRHRWQRDVDIAYKIEFDGKNGNKHEAGLKPKKTVQHWREHGFKIDNSIPDTLKTALIPLKTESGYEYWLGLQNFYAITRYNHSPLYAMAVYQLGEEIKLASREIALKD